jgi:hypothetical protein
MPAERKPTLDTSEFKTVKPEPDMERPIDRKRTIGASELRTVKIKPDMERMRKMFAQGASPRK